jgi:hypothetical protein
VHIEFQACILVLLGLSSSWLKQPATITTESPNSFSGVSPRRHPMTADPQHSLKATGNNRTVKLSTRHKLDGYTVNNSYTLLHFYNNLPKNFLDDNPATEGGMRSFSKKSSCFRCRFLGF